MLDSIKANLLNEERLLARESKNSDRTANALQIRANDRGNQRNKPRTPEKAKYAKWLKHVQCRHCKQIGHIEITCPAKPRGHASQATSLNSVDCTLAETEVKLDVQQATLEGDPSAYLASEKKL